MRLRVHALSPLPVPPGYAHFLLLVLSVKAVRTVVSLSGLTFLLLAFPHEIGKCKLLLKSTNRHFRHCVQLVEVLPVNHLVASQIARQTSCVFGIELVLDFLCLRFSRLHHVIICRLCCRLLLLDLRRGLTLRIVTGVLLEFVVELCLCIFVSLDIFSVFDANHGLFKFLTIGFKLFLPLEIVFFISRDGLLVLMVENDILLNHQTSALVDFRQQVLAGDHILHVDLLEETIVKRFASDDKGAKFSLLQTLFEYVFLDRIHAD